MQAQLGNAAGLVGAADLARPFARRFRRARARARDRRARHEPPGSAVTAPLRMSNVDAAWLGMDSPDNLMMVTGGAAPRQSRRPRPARRGASSTGCSRAYPKFSMRPLPSGSPFEQPVWTDDPDFDLGRHVVDAGDRRGRRAGWPGWSAACSARRSTCGTRRGSSTSWRCRPRRQRTDVRPGRPAAPLHRRRHRAGQRAALAHRRRPGHRRRTAAEPVTRDPRRPGMPSRLTAGSRDLVPVAGIDPLAPRTLRQAGESLRFGWRVLRTGVGPAAREPRPAHPALRSARHRQGRGLVAAARPRRRQAGRCGARRHGQRRAARGDRRRHPAALHRPRRGAARPADLRAGRPAAARRAGAGDAGQPVRHRVRQAAGLARRPARPGPGGARADDAGEGQRAGGVDLRDPRGGRGDAVLGAPARRTHPGGEVVGHRHQRPRADPAGLPGRLAAGAADVLGAAGRLGGAGCEHPQLCR